MTKDPSAVNEVAAWQEIADKRLEFSEWLCEKYKLNFSREVESFEQKSCEHHPYDREIDENENKICSICGKIIEAAHEDSDMLW